MARKKGAKVAANADTAVLDCRYDEAKRKNIPPAGLAAQGKVRETPKIQYAYDPHLPPVLRFDAAGNILNVRSVGRGIFIEEIN